MSLIGYARVSTEEQDSALQVDALVKAGCDEIFHDSASGADRSRPGLAQAMARLGPGDVLLFWKIDRLARSSLHLAEIAELLKAVGADMRCLSQPFDTTTPMGELIFTVLGAIAQFERSLIRERVKAGMAAAKARGVHCGRPRTRALQHVLQ